MDSKYSSSKDVRTSAGGKSWIKNVPVDARAVGVAQCDLDLSSTIAPGIAVTVCSSKCWLSKRYICHVLRGG